MVLSFYLVVAGLLVSLALPLEASRWGSFLLIDNVEFVVSKYQLRKYDREDLMSDQDKERRNKVKEMMKHAWDNYKRYAWGKIELKPVSKVAHPPSNDSYFHPTTINLGTTILVAMDTLYIMGMNKEFDEGREWISKNFTLDGVTTVQCIGGLLSCFALTGDTMFRDKAQHVADKLLPAFSTPTGLPHTLINPSTGNGVNYDWAKNMSFLADVGSLHLEFGYLSDLTGNPIYRNKVEKIRKTLKDTYKPNDLYNNAVDPISGEMNTCYKMDEIKFGTSLGALGDSFYEYLLKTWLLNKENEAESRQMFDEAMSNIIDKLIKEHNGLTFAGYYYCQDKIISILNLLFGIAPKMEQLACFSGGLFALASATLNTSLTQKYMDLAKKLTNTCHESYDKTPTKLGPSIFRVDFTYNGEDEDDEDAGQSPTLSDNSYILRCQNIESYFILWRLTKDQKYREWGWDELQAIEKNCRVDGGYTGIKNVFLLDSQKDDIQPRYFLGETLKYLYLLYSHDSLISLDDWVFNTDGHPLPVKGSQFYRSEE